MNRNSLSVRLGRVFQRLPLSFLRPIELPFVGLSGRAKQEPVMIVLLALPRSGSTLTYQVLTHGLESLYLTNTWNTLYALPLLGGWLSRLECADHSSDFQSSQGFVRGLCGPAEGLKFWSYWTGQGLNETSADADARRPGASGRAKYLRKILAVLTRKDMPFVTGYVGHALAVAEMQSLFPGAIFVRLMRDPLSNACSILRIRERRHSRHFSVFPKECVQYKEADIYRQVAAQVHFLNRHIDAAIDHERTISISYEALCENPAREVNRVVDFCNARGLQVALKRPLPARFDASIVAIGSSPRAVKLNAELQNFMSGRAFADTHGIQGDSHA